MYNGAKDWKPPIEIPAELCYEQRMNNQEFIECRIPDRNLPEEGPDTNGDNRVFWKSFMVKKSQVLHKDYHTNIIIDVNQGAGVTICQHIYGKNGKYMPDGNTIEVIDNYEIQSRIGRYFITL